MSDATPPPAGGISVSEIYKEALAACVVNAGY